MSFINDTEGVVYELTKNKLRTVKGGSLFYVKFDDIRKANYRTAQLFMVRNGKEDGEGIYIRVSIKDNSIGCRNFSPEVFERIMSAIKESTMDVQDVPAVVRVQKEHNAIDALIKRINRRFANTAGSNGLKLHKSLKSQVSTFGQFYVKDLNTGEVVQPNACLFGYAMQFNLSTTGIIFRGDTAHNSFDVN